MRRAQILFGQLAAALTLFCVGCSPLGDPIDSNISSSYYHAKSGDGVVFSAQGNWQSVGHSPVEGAKSDSFRPVDSVLGMDQEHVYYRQARQPQIERESFIVDGLVWRDASYVYYAKVRQEQLASVRGADPSSFRYLFPDRENPKMWARDASHYYLDHQSIDVDVPSFRFLSSQFVADRDQIYRNQQHLTPVAAVSGPITVINGSHLRMGNQIISAGSWPHRILTFETIEDVREISDQLVVIDGQLYEKGQLLTSWNGDVASFEAWPDSSTYARDDEYVYTLSPSFRRIEGADRASFVPADGYGSYATDAEHVYFRGQVLRDADRASFEIAVDAKGPYARDKYGRFYFGERQ